MNRQAASMAAICTGAVACISAGAEQAIRMVTSGDLAFLGAAGDLFLVGLGSYLLYVGHCRAMLPQK